MQGCNRLLFSACVLCSTLFANCQVLRNDFYPAGKVIDTVRCRDNARFRYSLYLPSNYSDTLKWPVIFVFDPMARSKLATTGFVPAAEKYGYIIACSGNSRNQVPWEELLPAINAMFSDVQSKFAIDTLQVYTAGFSGGARIASAIALQNTIFSGVIACGAGLPGSVGADNFRSFNLIGFAGVRDMNYVEMCELEKFLANEGSNMELRIFDGGHEWPSPDQLTGAIEWLRLQAMRAGKKKKDEEFLKGQFIHYQHTADSRLRNGDLTEAANQYQYILRYFPDNRSVSAIRKRLDSLKVTKEYIRAVKERERSMEWETGKEKQISSEIFDAVQSGSPGDSIKNVVSGQLRTVKNMQNSKDPDEKNMSARILGFISLTCYEYGKNFYDRRDFRAASVFYGFQLIIDPENKALLLLHAKACAQCSDVEGCIHSLERLVKLGYTMSDSLNDRAFDPVKNDGRFRKIERNLQAAAH
ncbi:MAG TPA: hypothetical protein VHO46_10275 [Bacteroidales bacterium]|nr:hypothetical protein [Bacteroidales bacterium]